MKESALRIILRTSLKRIMKGKSPTTLEEAPKRVEKREAIDVVAEEAVRDRVVPDKRVKSKRLEVAPSGADEEEAEAAQEKIKRVTGLRLLPIPAFNLECLFQINIQTLSLLMVSQCIHSLELARLRMRLSKSFHF